MDSTPSLSTLPNEILIEIIERLIEDRYHVDDLSTFRALRLTCKSLAVLDCLKLELFRKQSFEWSPTLFERLSRDGLQTLGPYMEEITFYTPVHSWKKLSFLEYTDLLRLQYMKHPRQDRSPLDVYDTAPVQPYDICFDYFNDVLGAKLPHTVEQITASYAAYMNNSQSMRKFLDEDHVSALATFFRATKSPITVRFHTSDARNVNYYRQWGFTESGLPAPGIDHLMDRDLFNSAKLIPLGDQMISAVISGLATSNATLAGIHLSCAIRKGFNWTDSSDWYELDLSNLTDLHIRPQIPTPWQLSSHEREWRAQLCQNLLSRAPSTVKTLLVEGDSQKLLLFPFSSGSSFGHLTRLNLHRLGLESEWLADSLVGMQQLRNLRIRECSCHYDTRRSSTGWRPIFYAIRSHLRSKAMVELDQIITGTRNAGVPNKLTVTFDPEEGESQFYSDIEFYSIAEIHLRRYIANRMQWSPELEANLR